MSDTKQLSFSPEALAEKYRLEREKRLRGDGLNQYANLTHVFSSYADDPHMPLIERAPIVEEFDAMVIGAGFSGMLTAARLREKGVDFRVVEKASDFGGTWYWNRYPGAACDTEAYIYLPLLEETGYVPSKKYVFQPEIYEHCQRVAKHFDLYRSAIFQTGVKAVTWVPEKSRWLVETDRGDKLYPRFVVLAGGLLHKPKIPNLPGVLDFKGHSFHTSRWDYDYTGGDSTGNLHKLADKRVGIIGTGATAIQSVPHLGAAAKHLYVFQRTPSSVDVRGNRPTDEAFLKSLKPGWQYERMSNFNTIVTGGYEAEDLVADNWTKPFRDMMADLAAAGGDMEKIMQIRQLNDYEKMEELRARISDVVKDPKTAAALKPYYDRFCKRPCFHDEYLPTFNRPNVTLVDTDGKGVDYITEKGVVSQGVEYELDCLIYSTGFEFGHEYTQRLGFDIQGESQFLSAKFRDACGTLHGMTSRGFPNLMVISTIQASGTTNFPHFLGEQARHAAYIVSTALERGAVRLEPSQKAEDEWLALVLTGNNAFLKMFEACTPSYFNNEGSLQHTEATARRGGYPGTVMQFSQLLADWRDAGKLEGLELTKG